MDALFPAILQSVPGAANMSAADQEEMRDFVSKTTQQVFGALGNGNGGGMGDIGGLMSSILGGAGGGGLPLGPTNSSDIHEHVDVALEDFFIDSVHEVKYHVRVFDSAINAVRKKKRKVNLTLPAGAPANHVIQVDGQGHYDPRTHSSGALFVHFHAKASDKFTRHSQDLHVNMDLYDFHHDPFFFDRYLSHPSGRVMHIRCPDGVCMGFGGRNKITIPVMGFPRFEEKAPGNLVINVVVDPKMYVHNGRDFEFAGSRDTCETSNAMEIMVKPAWISGPVAVAPPVEVEALDEESVSDAEVQNQVSEPELEDEGLVELD